MHELPGCSNPSTHVGLDGALLLSLVSQGSQVLFMRWRACREPDEQTVFSLRKALLTVEALHRAGCRPQPCRRIDPVLADTAARTAQASGGRTVLWLDEPDVVDSLALDGERSQLTRQAGSPVALQCCTPVTDLVERPRS
jgi:hypothetical protein